MVGNVYKPLILKNNMKNKYEKKEIVKRFKSKNGVGLLAYKGIWHGVNRDEEIKYIEVEETGEYIDYFIEEGDEEKYSFDVLLEDKIKELKNILILKSFEYGKFIEKGYTFRRGELVKEVVEELKLLIKEKVNIFFNEDFGVGQVYVKGDKYLVELSVYGNVSYPVRTKNLRKVAKFLIAFHSGDSNYGETYDDGRAMSIAFMKDSMSKEEREKLINDIDKKRELIFEGIK